MSSISFVVCSYHMREAGLTLTGIPISSSVVLNDLPVSQGESLAQIAMQTF